MRLLDKMKHKIRSFLEIHEDVSGTITLTNLNDFETEANIARVWSWGDRKALEQLYKNLDNGSGLNFGRRCHHRDWLRDIQVFPRQY